MNGRESDPEDDVGNGVQHTAESDPINQDEDASREAENREGVENEDSPMLLRTASLASGSEDLSGDEDVFFSVASRVSDSEEGGTVSDSMVREESQSSEDDVAPLLLPTLQRLRRRLAQPENDGEDSDAPHTRHTLMELAALLGDHIDVLPHGYRRGLNLLRRWRRRRRRSRGSDSGEDSDGLDEPPEDKPDDRPMTFDRNLPSTHSYLGDVEGLGGMIRAGDLFEPGARAIMPLLPLPNIILFPGERLPLRIFETRFVNMIKAALEGPHASRTFGVVNIKYARVGGFMTTPEMEFAHVGTTAEVRSLSMSESDGQVVLMAQGMQRFRVLKTWIGDDDVLHADVTLLADGPSCLPVGAFSPRPRCFASDSWWHSGDESAHTPVRPCRSLAHHDWWIYQMFDPVRLAAEARAAATAWLQGMGGSSDQGSAACSAQPSQDSQEESSKETTVGKQEMDTCMSQDETSMPRDPTALSFWLAFNTPLEDEERQRLLEIPSTPERLRRLISVVNALTVLRCRSCNTVVADRKDILPMSVEGTMGTYVNPGGYVHEMLTLRRVRGIVAVGERHSEDSWFPGCANLECQEFSGYTWTIAHCHRCGGHMGWRFDALSPDLAPSHFWGIRRPVLRSRSRVFERPPVDEMLL